MCKMTKTTDEQIRAIPLFLLPPSSKELLSSMLLQIKVIPTDDQERLFRDWRGLCVLAKLSFQEKASIEKSSDPVAAILMKWSNDRNVKVTHLLDMLEKLDRFDVYDDLYEDLVTNYKNEQTTVDNQNAPAPNLTSDVNDILTLDDTITYKKLYDAYILYADKDKPFANNIMMYLRSNRFEICTKDNVIPGHATLFAPVARLISERCQRIILLYSPDFIDSPANTFFRDYAQASSIESRDTTKIIPIMYRKCDLPPHLKTYHPLYYDENDMYETLGGANFWIRLGQAVNIGRMIRLSRARDGQPVAQAQLESNQSSFSGLKIVEMSASAPCIAHPDVQREGSVTTQRSASVDAVRNIRTSSPEEMKSDRNNALPNILINSIKNIFRRVSDRVNLNL